MNHSPKYDSIEERAEWIVTLYIYAPTRIEFVKAMRNTLPGTTLYAAVSAYYILNAFEERKETMARAAFKNQE